MEAELKGKNGEIVGSERYFKKINQLVSDYEACQKSSPIGFNKRSLEEVREKDFEKYKKMVIKEIENSPIDYSKLLLQGTKKDQKQFVKMVDEAGKKDFEKYKKESLEKYKKSLQDEERRIEEDLNTGMSTNPYIVYENRVRLTGVLSKLNGIGITVHSWVYDRIKQLRRLEDFHNQVIRIDRAGYADTIEAKLKWENGKNVLYLNAKVRFVYFGNESNSYSREEFDTAKKCAIEGFQKWNGKYQVFNNQSIEVNVTVTEDLINPNAISVNLFYNLSNSMSWGGKGIFDWQPTGHKMMFLNYYKPNNPQDSEDTNANAMRDEAKHEFGHDLGLGDAYKWTYIPFFYDMKGVNTDIYHDLQTLDNNATSPGDMVMNLNGTIRNNDIEMVILAFQTGKRQNYQKERPYIYISEALGRGN